MKNGQQVAVSIGFRQSVSGYCIRYHSLWCLQSNNLSTVTRWITKTRIHLKQRYLPSEVGGAVGTASRQAYDWRSSLRLRSSRPQVTVNRQMGEINGGLRMGGKSQAWDGQSKALPRLTRGLGGEHQKSRRRRLSQDTSCSDEMGRRNLKNKRNPLSEKAASFTLWTLGSPAGRQIFTEILLWNPRKIKSAIVKIDTSALIKRVNRPVPRSESLIS